MSKQADVPIDQNRPFASRTVWNPIGKRWVLIPKVPPQNPINRWEDIAKSDEPVLISGETGTGKEELANVLVAHSPRGYRKYAAVNCVGLEGDLFQSELFGHVKGSFSGAIDTRPGKLAALHKGTILLDEIGELTLHDQARLLRFMQTGEIQRVGEDRPRHVDVRVIATTNADVDDPKVFRPDLKQRFHPLSIPPLRKRPDDIIVALCLFLYPYTTFTAIDIRLLLDIICHDWPGNLRELSACCKRTLYFARQERSRNHGKDTVDFVLRSLSEFALPAAKSSKVFDLLQTCLQGAYGLAEKEEGASNWLRDAEIGNFNKLVAELIDRKSPTALHPRYIPLCVLDDPSALPKVYGTTRFAQICTGQPMFQFRNNVLSPKLSLVHVLMLISNLASAPDEGIQSIQSIVKYQTEMWEDGIPLGLDFVLAWLTTCPDFIPKYGEAPVPSGQGNLDSKKLKPDEKQMLELRARGMPTRKIAKVLRLAPTTVFDKLGEHEQLLEQLKSEFSDSNSDSPTTG